MSFIALAGLMLATRFHHFGSAISLPDASLISFFFAGLLLKKLRFFVVLFIEAVLIDYIAITQFSVSDFCISNAYVALIPTYAAMWYAGYYCQRFKTLKMSELSLRFGLLFAATSMAFLVSNGSFYLFSGRYPESSWAQYIERVGMYYPPYLTSTLIYGIVVFAVIQIIKTLKAQADSQHHVV
ncbi:MAG: hypothetical protein GQ569_05015 [Methylococcaceae bacterium]|nr:hypothetical protein [Methylococcaceae bacterium]